MWNLFGTGLCAYLNLVRVDKIADKTRTWTEILQCYRDMQNISNFAAADVLTAFKWQVIILLAVYFF